MRIVVIKKQDDLSLGEKVLRISIGGNSEQAYITYRGNLEEIKRLLTGVTSAFLLLDSEPEISPDEGKKYA
jgi:hypothetical protein